MGQPPYDKKQIIRWSFKGSDINKNKAGRVFETMNSEAYELYLKARYNYDNCKNIEDLKIVLNLTAKVIELDHEMLSAKVLEGAIYWDTGDYKKAMKIYSSTLERAKKLNDNNGVALCLNCIGIGYSYRGFYDQGLDHFIESLKIREALNDKRGIGDTCNNIGNVNILMGNFEDGLKYYFKALSIDNELNDMLGKGSSLNNIGSCYFLKGNYVEALNYLTESIQIEERFKYTYGLIYSLTNIGNVNYELGEFQLAMEFLQRSLEIQKKMGHNEIKLETTVYLYLVYKRIGKKYDKNIINELVDQTENIEYEINLRLHMLLNEPKYIINAFKQIQEITFNMDDIRKAKFIETPIPALIIERFGILK